MHVLTLLLIPEANIGLGEQTLQSDTLWSYEPYLGKSNAAV